VNALRILILVNGLWAVGNGILHDAFVLARHKSAYDRELLRLLMDGHVLITCGLIYLLAQARLDESRSFALWLCVITSTSMLVYCAMIFPFLKSLVTTVLNAAVLFCTIWQLLR
jgi:hypothetical protein